MLQTWKKRFSKTQIYVLRTENLVLQFIVLNYLGVQIFIVVSLLAEVYVENEIISKRGLWIFVLLASVLKKMYPNIMKFWQLSLTTVAIEGFKFREYDYIFCCRFKLVKCLHNE